VNATEQLKALNERYVENNFDPKIKTRIDSLQRVINERIGQADVSPANTPTSQQGLVAQRLTLKVSYDQAKNSIGIIQQQLAALNGQLNGIVPNEASVTQYENAAEIAQKEYLDILAQYNQ